MPNSPIRRFESCYMPPKKFWRFDNVNTAAPCDAPVQETENCSPVKEGDHKMGLMIDEVQSKPTTENSVERLSSPVAQTLLEDVPLDFSVRSHVRGPVNGLHNSTDNPLKGGEFKHPMHTNNYSDYTKKDHMPLMVFPFIPREGNSSPSGGDNNPEGWFLKEKSWNNHNNHNSYNGNQSSSSMDTSEKPTERHISINGLNGGTMHCRKSPKRNSSRESSPSAGTSILQGMLKSPDRLSANKISSKIQNIHISTTAESVQSGNNSEHVNTISPVMAAAGQQILPHLLPPVNSLVPLPLTLPFVGGMGFVRPPVFSGSFLTQASDASVLQALTQRRARRKKSEERPFKSYPIDMLGEKLQSVSANALAFGMFNKKIMANGMAARSPPSDTGANATMNESPEHANGAISSNPPRAIIGKDDPSNVQCSGDSNDSLPVARTETAEATSCTNNRKRKSTADVDKDDAYWDRRRKNNLAAKRSREARRQKEDTIANMALLFESQNVDLHQSLNTLTYKLSEVSGQLSKVLRENESLIIQNNILQERLSQKRCGHCGTQLPNVS